MAANIQYMTAPIEIGLVYICMNQIGVSKNRGILPPKMDGENSGKPY